MSEVQWISMVVLLLVHTAALFRWGGRIDAMLAGHEGELKDDKKTLATHSDFLSRHEAEIYLLKSKVGDLKDAVQNGGMA